MQQYLEQYFAQAPVCCFSKLKDKSAIATLNRSQYLFAGERPIFHQFIENGVLKTREMNRDINWEWPFILTVEKRAEYFYPAEKFLEPANGAVWQIAKELLIKFCKLNIIIDKKVSSKTGDESMQRMNGTIFSGNMSVVTVQDGVATVIHAQLAPLFFQRSLDVATWLEERAIDSHRTNSRLLKKALRLANRDDISTTLAVNAVTITDNYWFREADSALTWEDVRFRENLFDNLALRGDPDSFDQTPSRTPELTNTGSFEKCWRLIDGKWWIYKSGNGLEHFSELFIYHLGRALGFSMAHYEYADGYIRTLDFTENALVNFEPASAFMGEDEDYSRNFAAFLQISENAARDYLKMIYLDTICKNMDRHTKNYGVLRDITTGEILGLAPNYDNNIALISRGYPQSASRENDGLFRFFAEFLESNAQAKEMFARLDIPEVTEQMVFDCIQQIPIRVDRDFVVEFILNGQRKVQQVIS